MKDTMSLLLATAILAAGGLGLCMFKTPDDEQKGGGGEEYNEDSLFGSGSFWSSNKSDDEAEEDDSSFHEPKVRTRGGKTKRNKKSTGTKRRYY